jgi:hypothetical protein
VAGGAADVDARDVAVQGGFVFEGGGDAVAARRVGELEQQQLAGFVVGGVDACTDGPDDGFFADDLAEPERVFGSGVESSGG